MIYKHLFTFTTIYRHWDSTGSWNPSSWMTNVRSDHMIDNFDIDNRATQEVRPSAAFVLASLIRNTHALAPDG